MDVSVKEAFDILFFLIILDHHFSIIECKTLSWNGVFLHHCAGTFLCFYTVNGSVLFDIPLTDILQTFLNESDSSWNGCVIKCPCQVFVITHLSAIPSLLPA